MYSYTALCFVPCTQHKLQINIFTLLLVLCKQQEHQSNLQKQHFDTFCLLEAEQQICSALRQWNLNIPNIIQQVYRYEKRREITRFLSDSSCGSFWNSCGEKQDDVIYNQSTCTPVKLTSRPYLYCLVTMVTRLRPELSSSSSHVNGQLCSEVPAEEDHVTWWDEAAATDLSTTVWNGWGLGLGRALNMHISPLCRLGVAAMSVTPMVTWSTNNDENQTKPKVKSIKRPSAPINWEDVATLLCCEAPELLCGWRNLRWRLAGTDRCSVWTLLIIVLLLPPAGRAAQNRPAAFFTWWFGAVASVSGPAAMATGALAAMAVSPRWWAEDVQHDTSVSTS